MMPSRRQFSYKPMTVTAFEGRLPGMPGTRFTLLFRVETIVALFVETGMPGTGLTLLFRVEAIIAIFVETKAFFGGCSH